MKATEFALTHATDREWVEMMERQGREVVCLQPGQRGQHAGYPATVKQHYFNGMYEVCLPGGVACIAGEDFVCDAKVARSKALAQIDEALLAKGYRMEPSLGAFAGMGHSLIEISNDEMPDEDPAADVRNLAFQWSILNDAVLTDQSEIDEAAAFLVNIDLDA